MTDAPGSDSTTGTKSFGRTALLTYLLVGMIFPSLFFALFYGWKLLLMLLMVLHLPIILLKGVWLLAVLSSLVGSFVCCRKIWRDRPKS